MAGPKSPEEIEQLQTSRIPDAVFEVFNELIAEKGANGHAVVNQREVVAGISKRMGCSVEMIFDKGWLNVESLYQKAGWSVVYDKPAYNETYEATFTFRARRKKR
jgi:hypothetical protein